MSIMVTGGTWFIGHRIIRKLVERGEVVGGIEDEATSVMD